MKRPWITLLWMGLLCAPLPGLAGQTASFTPLGDLPGGPFSSKAFGISPDGSIVVGHGVSALGRQAFSWSGGVMTALDVLPGSSVVGIPFDAAYGVSSTGGRIAGRARDPALSGRIAVWDLAPPSDLGPGTAWGVSADGSTVVGELELPGDHSAFRWGGGPVIDLGTLGAGDSAARAASSSGAVIVGRSANVAFIWQNGEMDFLRGLDPVSSVANDVSSNGKVIVGSYLGGIPQEAFRWRNGSARRLGGLWSIDVQSEAYGVSGNGSVVVGTAFTDLFQFEAFAWTPLAGMRNVKTVLEIDYGLNLSGWVLESAEDISSDGRTIVGWGINPSGAVEGWMAQIPFIPPPPAICGDVNMDRVVDGKDVDDYRAFLADPVGSPLTLGGAQRCTAIDPLRPCDVLDSAVLARGEAQPGLPPGVSTTACEAAVGPVCGDVTDDGLLSQQDLDDFRHHLVDPAGSPLSIRAQAKCRVIDPPRPCDILDWAVTARHLAIPSLPPGPAQICPAVTGEEL